MEDKMQRFIERLSNEIVGNQVENLYNNEAQRENLRLYLIRNDQEHYVN